MPEEASNSQLLFRQDHNRDLNPSYSSARLSRNDRELYDRHLQLIMTDRLDDCVEQTSTNSFMKKRQTRDVLSATSVFDPVAGRAATVVEDSDAGSHARGSVQ